jgi:hypothetical protein
MPVLCGGWGGLHRAGRCRFRALVLHDRVCHGDRGLQGVVHCEQLDLASLAQGLSQGQVSIKQVSFRAE